MERVAQRPVPGADRSPFLNQVEAFADAVIGNGCYPFTPERDLQVMSLVLKAQRMAAPRESADAA